MQQVPVRVLLLTFDHFDVALTVVQQRTTVFQVPLLQLLIQRFGQTWKFLHNTNVSHISRQVAELLLHVPVAVVYPPST
jgi:hypothetical protein